MGEVFYNNKRQPFVILKTFRKNKNTYCTVKFIETGSVRDVRKNVVNEGCVKDRYAKDVYGVACIGMVKKVGNEISYNKWRNMISRCLNKNDKDYHSYGELGVTVCDRWLCFENFVNDVKLLDGYNEALYFNRKLEIDKDFKQLDKDYSDRVYSPETCCLVSQLENKQMSNRQYERKNLLTAYGFNDGKRYFIESIPKFSAKHNLLPGKVYECINGKRPQHKGWTFNKTEMESA